MVSKKYDVAKLSNAFSTGSGGTNFERHIQAVFVLALLVDGFSPIIDAPIERLEFQAKHLGYDIDDLVVISSIDTKLLCQMKHSLTVAEGDGTFQDVIAAAWSDFKKDSFDTTTDKIALITSFIAKDSIHALRYIHDQSLAASSADTFIDRIYQTKFTSQTVRGKFEIIKNCLEKANDNISVSNEDLWEFCRCFTLSIFDLDYEDSVNRVLAQSLIRCKTEKDAKLVWRSLADFCGTCNQKAATITRDTIPEDILTLFGHATAKNTVANIPVGFTPNSLWAAIALIGSWDENNEYDIRAIEQITGRSFNELQHDCQGLLLSSEGNLSLRDGKWKIQNRQIVIDAVRNHFFDNTIKNAFQVANGYIKEISKQFSEDGEFGVMIPASGRFNNSDGFRKGLIEGLCILNNGVLLSNCTDNLLALESRKLICNAFNDPNWVGLVSMSDILSGLAEMNPSVYLSNLEELIRSKPHEVEKLFPKKQNRALIDQNFISNILFTLEELAWDERYIVQCIRCLGALERLTYEQTNWVNTPINTIVNILIPFLPQTCASVEKQKNAVQTLKVDDEGLYWKVLTHLLPKEGPVTIPGTARPKYLKINIPEEISISDEDRHILFQHYIRQAISTAGSDSAKLAQLAEHTSYMKNDDISSLFGKICEAGPEWNDEEKCGIWIKLCDLKYRVILDNKGTLPDTDIFKELCATIDIICPQNIMYRHKRLYLSHFNEFLFDEKRWEELDQNKQNAVEEIYQTLGLNSVVEFGDSVNAGYEIGSRLGRAINTVEFSKIIPEYRTGNNAVFYSNLTRAFFGKNGIEAMREVEIKNEDPTFVARLLKDAPFVQELIDIIPEFLPDNEVLFWETVEVPPCYAGHCDYNIVDVIQVLLSHHRAPAAIYAIGQSVDKLDIDDALLCKVLMQAPTDRDANKIHQFSVRKIIRHLQNSGKTDIHTLSDIEYIYLPWLDEHSPTSPRAINYRLANEPEYFCSIMESTYKKRHETSSDQVLPPAVRERLFQLTYHYRIIPGTDWDGVFHNDIFSSWLATVKAWAKANDRYEVSMQTIGGGLSYAKFSEDGVIDQAIMSELNAIDNDELREGYQLGIFNQRGVHWIDPEGKPEKELAQKYNQRADAVEALGYSRFSGLLREIAAGYLSEAKENAKHYALTED